MTEMKRCTHLKALKKFSPQEFEQIQVHKVVEMWFPCDKCYKEET